MSIQYTTNLAGKPIVKFNCPKCRIKLTARLTEAGNVEKCGDCGTRFKVPGEDRLKAMKEAELAKEKAKTAQEAEQKRKLEETQRRKAAEEANRTDVEKRQAELAQEARVRQENQRKEELKDSTLDLSDHDWSSGAPYCYELVQTAAVTGSANWLSEFGGLINARAEEGWEFFRCEDFTYVQPGGCLGLGAGAPVSVKVVVFRKPADFRRKEIHADQSKWS